MAIIIQAQLAKKVPIPGAEYSSQQASITLNAEVADLTQVATEAQRLYSLAEQAVDAQLAGRVLQPAPSTPPKASPAAAPPPSPTAASRPYAPAGPPRRTPVTDSQLRFLDRLIRQAGIDPAAILQQHQIGSLRDLSCKAAAQLIDELKAQGVRS